MFKEGSRSTEMTRPGRLPHVKDPDTRPLVDQTVQCDRQVMLRLVSEQFGYSVEHVHHIVTQVLG
jgi:hypothetical protein